MGEARTGKNMDAPREFTMKAGRRVEDGTVSLSAFLPGVLSLSVSRKGERAGTVQLTREQARRLRQALAELELMLEPEEQDEGRWVGVERREDGLAA